MPEHLRALVIVLGVAVVVFGLAKAPLCRAIYTERGFAFDRNLWFGVTLAAFLSHNFWIYSAVAGAMMLIWGSRSANPVATYALLLFAAPPFAMEIPGFGLVQHLFAVNHYRLLALAMLLPQALRLYCEERSVALRTSDYMVIGLLGWMLLVRIANDSVTGSIRGLFYLVIDYWLPYYVASRSVTTLRQFQQVAGALAVSAVIVSALSVFEMQRFWLLYASLALPWDVVGQMPMYLSRGSGPDGILRSLVSLGHPIALGYALLLCLMMVCAIHPQIRPGWRRSCIYAAISAGFIASMSRGPWVGAAAALLAFLAVGPGAARRTMLMLVAGGIGLGALLLTPYADRVIAYLPFVGTIETGNIEYRSRLIDVSLELLARNPLVGDFNFTSDPSMEEMRQGEGIIDIVNTYLQIALPFGLIGLFLFLGAFASAFAAAWRARRAAIDPDVERLGRALCAAVVGVLVTISTVSSIFVVPTLYWMLAGLCVSYACAFAPQPVPTGERGRLPIRPAPHSA